MDLFGITEVMLAAKKKKSLSFSDLGKVVKRNEVW
jgi:cyanate lyase